MELEFENLDNIPDIDVEFIKIYVRYYLIKIFWGKEYSSYLNRVDIVENMKKENQLYGGYYDYDSNSIVLKRIKEKIQLENTIHHELRHVEFRMNNEIEFKDFAEYIGYKFLDEFYANLMPLIYNYENKRDNISLKWIQDKINNDLENFIIVNDNYLETISSIEEITKGKELDNEVNFLINEKKIEVIDRENYYFARLVASIYFVNMSRENIVNNVKINEIIKRIKMINFNKIKKGEFKEMGKILLG